MKTQKSTHLKFLFLLVAGALALTRFEAGAATWNNSAGDRLWTNAVNWTPNAVPTFADGALFDNTSGFTNVQGDVNNIVDTNTTIADLDYYPISPNTHTTLINPGVTLTVGTNSASVDAFGLNNAVNAGEVGYVAIKGPGASLAIGNLTTPSVVGGGTYFDVYYVRTVAGVQTCTLDMSGLDNFTFGGGIVRVGGYPGGNTSRGAARGTLILAKTNIILAGAPPGSVSGSANTCGVMVGARASTTVANDVGDLQLGITNTILTDYMKIGGYANDSGTMRFQTNVLASNPALTLRSTNGIDRIFRLGIGDSYETAQSTSSTAYGNMDLTGGTVDALVNNLYVGRSVGVGGTTARWHGNGTLTITAGTIDATTMGIGVQGAGNRAGATGVVNVRSNASLIVGTTITMGYDYAVVYASASGTLNIAHGGQVTVTNDVVENSPGVEGYSTINLTNGTLTVGGVITVDTLNVYSGVVSNTGVATVTTLSGAGTVKGSATVAGSLAPGNSIGTLTVASNLVLAGTCTSAIEVDTDTLAHDLVTGISNVTCGGTLAISPSGGGGALTNGATMQLFSANSYSGSIAVTGLPTLGPGLLWNTNTLTTSGTLGIQQVAAAVNDTASRPAGFPLTILKSVLVANDTGAGPMSVLSTDSTSTNGAAITTNVNYVFYSPPLLNPDVTDSFTYTMTDGYFTSVGTVVVTISSPPTNQSLNITGISTNGDGNYTISFAGVPTNIYLVQATTNIVTPIWVSIGTNTAGTNGLWSFTDLEATNYPSRFYRTARP